MDGWMDVWIHLDAKKAWVIIMTAMRTLFLYLLIKLCNLTFPLGLVLYPGWLAGWLDS
jgi:hypothetical protein